MSTIHGHTAGKQASRTYETWHAMKRRCSQPNHDSFKWYGGRGITVCDRWLKFGNFLEDMGVRPEGMTIDRMDSDDDYKPENCRWATHKEQQRNLRSNRRITYKGKTRCLIEWAEILGITPEAICYRLKVGWSVHQALIIPKYEGLPA